MKNERKPFHETVAEKLIEQLQQGTAPWQKPWEPGEPGMNMPLNPTTGKRYKGINALHLMSQGHEDQRWMTYKQAVAADAQVRRGEKGTQIQYWKFSDEQPKIDSSGKPVLNGQGEPVTETIKLERPYVFFATVFNAEQIDGLAPPEPRKSQTWNPVWRAENLLQASGAAIHTNEQERAFYRQSSDSVHLPDRSQFPSAANFYATALHELGHWTGHESRLARDMAHPFGSEGYAREELRAEIASMILGDELGIGHDGGQHAAYVQSWIKVLQEDPLEIFRAAADAEKIQDYLLGVEQKQVLMQAESISQDGNAHGAAFGDANGVLRDWISGQEVPEDWRGVLQENGEFWYVCGEVGGLSYTRLAATTLHDARAEVAIHEALSGTVDDMLDAFDLSLILDSGLSVDTGLREHSLATLASITGTNPEDFAEHANDRLITLSGFDHQDDDLAHITNIANRLADKAKELTNSIETRLLEVDMDVPQKNQAAEAFDTQAETSTLSLLEQGALLREADSADAGQLQRMQHALNAMSPLEEQNPFWQRHELPARLEGLQEKVDTARAIVEVRQIDAPLVLAMRSLLISQSVGRDHRREIIEVSRESEAALGFALPLDWNGRARVEAYGSELAHGEQVFTTNLPKGATPDAWGVFTQHNNGGYSMVASFSSAGDATAMAERLAVIAAQTTLDEYEKAAKLARINEERVQRDPSSTKEDITAAREARKDAEFVATTNEEDMRRRIESNEKSRLKPPEPSGVAEAPKFLIDVPYKQNDEAKDLGAKWDRQKQSWYVPADVDTAPFAKWAQKPSKAANAGPPDARTAADTQEIARGPGARQYLAVAYANRAAAKAAGAEWDGKAKSWYAGPKADMTILEQWKPENVPVQQGPAMTARQEFAEALKFMGCIISGEHPIMDSKPHRITVEGEKFTKNSGSGFYVGHLDNHPAGYIKNNKTGNELTWRSKGYVLDPEQKAKLAAEAANKHQAREADRAKRHELASARVTKQLAKLAPVALPTSYMQSKGIEPQTGAYTDKDGKITYLPATDVEGKQWTMQYILEDGTKRFAKDSRKEGCFHVVGGMADLAVAPALVVCEGYATAAQLKESLGYPTVSAFDSGNLPLVAEALHKKFPGKPVVIAGDDDRYLELVQGTNPGRRRAEAAAALVGGTVVLPIFAPGENGYPNGLELVTPALYREHLRTGDVLSDAQLAALNRMKNFTDFNDLAHRSELGQEGLHRQLQSLSFASARDGRATQARQELTNALAPKLNEHDRSSRLA